MTVGYLVRVLATHALLWVVLKLNPNDGRHSNAELYRDLRDLLHHYETSPCSSR